jgi:hypothetical protein
MTNGARPFTHQELGAMRRGTWRAVEEWGDGQPGEVVRHRRTAALCCPGCGSVGQLGPDHAISADGIVQPAVACLAPGCNFFEHVRLEGWAG